MFCISSRTAYGQIQRVTDTMRDSQQHVLAGDN